MLALPPFGWWPLGPAAVALLGAALRGQPLPWRALIGGGAGLVLFGLTLRWAVIFTVPGYVLLVSSQAAFLALAAALAPPRRGALLALPGTVVLVELVRHRWPLSGLPLSGLDLSQAEGPLRSLAALGGPLSLLLATAVVGVLVLVTVRGPGMARRILAASCAVAALAAVVLLPTRPGTSAIPGTLRVATVQGGGVRGVPEVRADPAAVFDRHVDASAGIDGPVDLVLWPEDVVDLHGPFAGSPQHEALVTLARRLGATVVAGVVVDADPQSDARAVRRFRNLAVAIAPDGSITDLYDKVIRVPFGEYVPWRSLVDRIADLSLIPRDAVPGTGPGTLTTPAVKLGVSISFEGMFARHARAAVRDGASLLLIPTNAASYVTADVPAQQVAAANLRALETGRSVLVAAPTGPSAIVDAAGTVLARSELERPAVLEQTVQRRGGLTPYARLGDTPAAAVAAGLVIAAGAMANRRRDQP